ncbi:uncharacterized protein N7483_005939 [Penicillium malachiteum]|uniref:uncharacterized protein n=1 Tax=Penicillium malachiteum TaxID=1324776 RepID=UPI002546F72D|nr:uncharacterized protein N7483_005939 [Penicillium malachiteum]KAJ5731431.1 hypothetical protein N7483_005939 [Penicillium malachiteum]
MSSKSNVLLIPWDPESVVHRQALLKQRIKCSWHMEKVEHQWRELQKTGGKCIYWIVIPPDDSPTTQQLRTLLGPKADETIQDTATSINAVPREPSQAVFTPIGHISLDSENPDAKDVELDIPSSGAFWIKTFYVTQCLQSQGIGRAAMDQVEEMAIREPLNAKTLLLDTVEKDDQMREDFAIISYGAIPKVPNEVWYGQRGYRLIKTVLNFYNIKDKNDKIWDTKTVFMRKDIL